VAADVTEHAGAAAPADQARAAEASAPEAPTARSRLRPFRGRFAVAYAGLAVALGAGIAGLIVVLGGTSGSGSSSSVPAWSGWQPAPGREAIQLSQIVKHVAPGYRLPNGDQLLTVLTKTPPSISSASATLPIRFVAVKGLANPDSLTSTNSVLFTMCGLGVSCAIATGQPSVGRAQLVRREALELALYTFKYIGGVQYVVALVPPKPGAQPQYAVYFRRSDLATELDHPLADTLAAKTPRPAAITSRESSTIDRLAPTYRFQVRQEQLGDIVLVLQAAA
jgi:hypothetical protein